MSSNIKVQRICQHCGKEFTARTTVTRFCGNLCNKRAYKDRLRALKVGASDQQLKSIKDQPLNELKLKEFLTAKEVASLLNCSLRSVYYFIESGNIRAVNLGQRMTRIKRSELDSLFDKPQLITQDTPAIREFEMRDISEWYTTETVREKYGISESGLRGLILKHKIPKFRKGWFAYVPKPIIDDLLSKTKSSK